VVLATAAGCGGGSGGSKTVDPEVVQKYVLVKEATGILTRVILYVQGADEVARSLERQRPGSPSAKSYAEGLNLSWEDVGTALASFNARHALAVPGLGKTVSEYEGLATNWQHGAEAIRKGGGRPPQGSITSFLHTPISEEARLRLPLAALSARLARMTCSMEQTYPQLAVPKAAAASCSSAKQLEHVAAALRAGG
jgi:hypothetical protein